MPRPPETTIAASVRSGTAGRRARLAVGDPGRPGGLGDGDLDGLLGRGAGGLLGVAELGLTVMIGVPLVTVARDGVAPAKTDCVVCTPSGPAWTSTASVIRPEAVLIARRAAISLPSAEEAISTAAGEAAATSWASSSALGATR